MRALVVCVLAAAVAGCVSPAHFEESDTRQRVVSKSGSQKAKSVRPKQDKVAARPSAPARPKRADAVTERAKAAVAARLDDPASAEFYNLQRAQRNLLHVSMDTICGHVRVRGGDSLPFLYIIGNNGDGDAYVVNGRSEVSKTVYGAVCK
jgi:hypothetical protein